MKIKSIKVTPVRVPATRIGIMSRDKRTHAARTLVEVETDCGITGVGETRGEWSAAIIKDKFAPHLIGLDPSNMSAVRNCCLDFNSDDGFPEQLLETNAFAAIDLALWDIAGKEAGKPVFELLGGLAREEAAFVAYAYMVDPDDGHSAAEIPDVMAKVAADAVGRSGARMFEFKVGRYSIDCEIATIRSVRQALGAEIDLAIDANKGYSLQQASSLLTGIGDCRIANFEEPVRELADMEALRGQFDVPVSTHCINLDALRHYPRIDGVVSDLHLHGGISSTLSFIDTVNGIGKAFWLRSTWELGVSWAAMCQLALAVPTMQRPSQTLIDWVADDLLINSEWQIVHGVVHPVYKPGLGVELNRAALERYATGS